MIEPLDCVREWPLTGVFAESGGVGAVRPLISKTSRTMTSTSAGEKSAKVGLRAPVFPEVIARIRSRASAILKDVSIPMR